MSKINLFSAFVVWLAVSSLIIGCNGSFRPEVPFAGDKGVKLCLMTVHPISWEPYQTPTGRSGTSQTSTPVPTRTLAPNALLPNRVVIERGRLLRSSRTLDTERTWVLDDATKVAQLYCTILTLPSIRPNCSDSSQIRPFRMQFKRDETLVDDFFFIGFGCNSVYLDLEPLMRDQGQILIKPGSDERYTNGCFWKYLAETLNVPFTDLPFPTQDPNVIATTYAYEDATRVAMNATTISERATAEILNLTETPDYPDPAATRRARATLQAKTQTRTPTATIDPVLLYTQTPSPFPVLRSNCS